MFGSFASDTEKTFRAVKEAMEASGYGELSVEKYNAKLEQFFTRYEAWLDEVDEYAMTRRRSVPLRLEVRNDGTAPAHDLDVTITAGPGVGSYEKDDKALRVPREPDLPERVIPKVSPYSDPFSQTRFHTVKISPIDPSFGTERGRLTVSSRKLKTGSASLFRRSCCFGKASRRP